MFKRSLVVSITCAFALVFASPGVATVAQMDGTKPEELLPFARFDPAIPTQEEVTGVVPGARPLRHDELLRFFEALAEASPRAKLFDYARTHEGRRAVYLAIGESATVADLLAGDSGSSVD